MIRLLLLASMLSAGPFEVSKFGDAGMGPIPFKTARFSATTGSVVLFYAPLNTNGIEAADPASSWPVTGVTAPDVAWWGDDPTGSGGKTTDLFTAAGTPVAGGDSPFCSDGSWSDLTSGCQQYVRFDAAGDYYTSNTAAIANAGSADFSVCVLYRTGQTSRYQAATREASGNGEGWGIYTATATANFHVENHNGDTAFAVFNTYGTINRAWHLYCGTFDYDGNLTAYMNGVADGTAASPGGTIASAEKLGIAAAPDGSYDVRDGDIVALFFWNSLLDATDIAELYEYFQGILDTKGAPVAFTNTGPVCCWVDGAIECYGDDFARLGCELPPGVTGAGSPASAFQSIESQTNEVVYSRKLDEWAAGGGTPNPVTAGTDLFRDGRSTYSIEDNDAGTKERIQSAVIDVTALDATDNIQICAYTKSGGTELLDIRTLESGVCAGATVNHAAYTTSTSWTQTSWTHTLGDGTCTSLRIEASAADLADAANTGGPTEVVFQTFLDQDWCPPIYIETAAAAVTGGRDILEYNISGVAALANPKKLTISSNFTKALVDVASNNTYVFAISKTSDGSEFAAYRFLSSEGVRALSTGSIVQGTVGPTTVGTVHELVSIWDWPADEYSLSLDGGTPDESTNAAATPVNLDTLRLGQRTATEITMDGGNWQSEVKVTSP